MRRTSLPGLFCVGLLAASVCAQTVPSASSAQVPALTLQNYARLPLGFEKRAGGSGERFVARGQGYVIGLERGKATIGVAKKDQTSHAVSLEFAGSRPSHAIPGPELPGKINHILGNDPRKWQIGLSSYERITYPDTYPGIDVVYYGNQQQLEFDLVVRPGANPAAVRLKVEGADKLSIDGSGALSLGEASGSLRVALPQIYQEVNGTKKNVPGHYTIAGRDEVAFKVDPWDHTRPLVIDPTIVYSAMFGGGLSTSAGQAIALDSNGNILIAGYTYDADFPTVNAAQKSLAGYTSSSFENDAFVGKINAAGTAFIYSTFLGGSGSDSAVAIAVDSTGAAWVAGNTQSSDFPVLNAAQPTFGEGSDDAFVARFSSAGVLQFSTYLGGNGFDLGSGIAVDSSNNGYVTGQTYSSNFPTTAGVVETSNPGNAAAFATKYSPAGAVLYSTLLGDGNSYGYGIAVDSTFNAYVTGLSYDSTFPGAPGGGAQTTNNGSGDAFVTKLNPNATALLYFTFLGGTAYDYGLALAVDSSGDAYVAGRTSSTGLATASAAQTTLAGIDNAFAAELNPSGSAFTYVTYLGGNRNNYLSGMALDGSGNVYLTGYTDSTNFPTTAAFQPTLPINGVSLFNSTNSAVSFSGFDSNLPGAVSQISINPAGTSAVALTEAGIYRTVNGGASWTQQYNGAFYDSSYLTRSPAAPGTLYAAQCCAAVYQSTDDGVTWNFESNPNQSNGIQGIIADPLNAATVYLFGDTSPNVYISTNGGSTFSPAGSGLPAASVQTMAATTDGTLYAATSGSGVYTSTNQGTSWAAANTGLPPVVYANPYSLSASGTTVYFAADSTIYETTNDGASWTPLNGAPFAPSAVAASPQNPSVLYALSYGDMVYESSDGGMTWSLPATGLPSNLAYNYGVQLVVDPSNSAHALLVVPVVNTGFVAKLNSSGSALTYSTYLGGPVLSTQPFGVATDGAGNAYVTGYTDSSGFPVTSTALPTGPSGPFITKISDTTAACTSLTVSPATGLASQYGGTLTFSVVAPTGCGYNVSSNQPWAVVSSSSLGVGVGTVTVQITPQSTTQSATLTVGTQTIPITLPSLNCSYSLDMNSYPVPAAGGTVAATLTATIGCPWAVTNNYSSAVSITSGASGSGNGTINLAVAQNPYTSPLNYSLAVGNTQISIAQAAASSLASQTITFFPVPNQIFGVSPFVIDPTASSGLPVGLASTTPAVCKTASILVQLLKAGTCSITATQPGNSSYNAATPVTQSFVVSVANPSGTLTPVPNSPFAVGSNPYAVAVGDFNGDGIPDLAVANGANNNVTILLGNGSGGFAPAQNSPFAGGTSPISVAVGDFNGDGIQDLALADYVGDNVTVLLGNGSGGFAPAPNSPFTVGSNPQSVVVGDFNGDAIQDLAIANYSSNNVTVLLGNGSGGFAPAQGSPFAVEAGAPISLVVGDFNGDGIQDLATANLDGNNVTVLLGNATGGFAPAANSPFAVGSQPSFLAVGDFNADGIQDLATANSGSNNVTVLLGNGSGGFAPAPSSPFAAGTAPFSVAVADFNGDGIPDLVAANLNDNTVTLLLGTGSAGFAPAPNSPFAVGTKPVFVAVADFNGDGIEDLATANYDGNNVTVLLGAVNASPTITTTSLPGGAVGIAYSQTLAASGGVPPYHNWTVVSGALPPGLTINTATGLIAMTPTSAAGSPFSFGVTVQDSENNTSPARSLSIAIAPAQTPVISGITNASSNALPPLAPGSLASLFGTNLASGTATAAGIPLPFTLGAVSVSVNGYAAALAFVSPGQINFQIPYETAVTGGNPNATVTVTNSGSVSAGFQFSVALASPGISLIQNPNTSANTAANPIAPGAAAMVYFTGLGATNPAVADGAAAPSSPPLATPVAASNVTVGSLTASVPFIGLAPGEVGLAQANAVVPAGLPAGSYPLVVTVNGRPSPAATVYVSGPAPSLTSVTPNTAPADSPATQITISGSNFGGGSTVSFTPSGGSPATITPSSIQASQIVATIPAPQLTSAGTAKVSITNGLGTVTNQLPFTITAPLAPSISFSTGSISTVTGGSVSASFSASGGTPPYKFSVSGQPAGVILGSGSLSGSPTQAGIFNTTVTVTDTNQYSASAAITINVLGLTTTTLANGTTGEPYAVSIGAAGGTGSYSFSASGLPAGLSLTSYGYLNGTVKTAGTYPLSITVSSGGLSAGGTLSLTIAQPQALSISQVNGLMTGSNGTVKVQYSQALAATGGLPPYTWSLLSGALPQGLSLSAAGIVSGTPADPGSFSFGVQVVDTAGASATSMVMIAIQPAPLIVTTQSLPPGMIGVDYPQQQLTITGGVPPYMWALGSGSSLPSGMSLSSSGVLSGVPGVTGTSSFGVTVTDHAMTNGSADFSLTIRPLSADLILTSGSLAFSLLTPAVAAPPSQSVGVQSTVASTTIAYAVSVSPAAPWLAIANGNTTPDSIQVSIVPTAFTLSPGSYQTTISATCTSNTCSGHTQTVSVSLTVTGAPPNLQISTRLLAFATTSVSAAAISQPINIQNTGGGSLGFASVSCEAPWCATGPAPSSLGGGASAAIPVTVNPSLVSPGFYRTQVDITTSAGQGSVPVTLFIAANATMTLAPAGEQFNQLAGSSPGNPNGSFLVSVNNSNPVNFSAAVLPGASWLVVGTPAGTSASTQPGTVSYSIDPAVAGTLAVGAYYGEIEITSSDVSNSPQDFEVVLNVSPAAARVVPDPEPGGLLFITTVGGVLPPQTVTVYSDSVQPLTFQASAATANGGGWLSVTPATGTASLSSPGVTMVSVDASKLTGGVYQGGVSYSLSATAVRTVNVTLIVTSAGSGSGGSSGSSILSGQALPRASGCTPSRLVPAQTGLVQNFFAPAGWPTPLAVLLFDDCGSVVNNGQIVATFSNGDPPLALPLVNPGLGLYSGTWSPANPSSQVSIDVTASAPNFAAATSPLSGAVTPNAVPLLTPNGTLHSFNPLVGAALAPGTIVEIFGQNLASATATSNTVPLLTAMDNSSVIIGGMEAPLYYVSPGQIDAQVPFELQSGQQYQVIVSANGALTTPQPIQLSTASPGLAASPDGTLIAQHSDGSLVSQTSPASGGEYLVAYLAGLGDTTVPVASGTASPSSPLASPSNTLVLTINGAQSPIYFAGLTPGLVGLYQMNFQVPAGLPTGNITIVVSQNGQASNQTVLPYQP
jgi:uncharacterized protein (TIGR03437 family)